MSKERYNQIINEAYDNFIHNPDYKAKCVADLMGSQAKQLFLCPTKEEFVNKCKTDSEFSEKWGLTIEERELSLEERIVIKNSKNIFISKGYIDDNGHLNDIGRLKLDKLIPTKLITLTYNNETVESYE